MTVTPIRPLPPASIVRDGCVRIGIVAADVAGDAISLQADCATGLADMRYASAAGAMPVTEVRLPPAGFRLLARLIARPPHRLMIRMPAPLAAIAAASVETERDDALEDAYRSAKAIELVCELVRHVREGVIAGAAEPSRSLADGRRLSAAMRLIDDGWRQAPTLDSLARACGLNREKLTRGFRERYGCTVGEALAERRLRHAEALLAETDLAVGIVGHRSGYRSEASFCRAFRRRYGLPPMAFRKERMSA